MSLVILVSKYVYKSLINDLRHIGQVVFIDPQSKVYESINTHSDIFMAYVEETLFIDEDLFLGIPKYVPESKWLHSNNIVPINTTLGNRYPLSVPFNGHYCEKTWVHNLEFTAPQIKDFMKEKKIKTIHINQGYSKCTLLLLKGKKGITSDKGIYQTLSQIGYDILLISEGYIHLLDKPYGFIGGCCGVFMNQVFVNGDFDFHPDGQAIREFIIKSGYSLIEVKGLQLEDIGSMVFFESKGDD